MHLYAVSIEIMPAGSPLFNASFPFLAATRPFKMAFRTTAGETIIATTSSKGKTNELSLTPYGTLGFSVKFTQQTC